jgi:hypothetical protein
MVRPSLPTLRSLLSSAFGAVLVWAAAGCSTEAVGIDACRSIEAARCTAAPVCEGSDNPFGIVTEQQVENCITYYRDHCLVGLENTSEEPAEDDVVDCVDAIAKVAKCHTDKVEKMVDCDVAVSLAAQDESPCAALANPETIDACAFVAESEE